MAKNVQIFVVYTRRAGGSDRKPSPSVSLIAYPSAKVDGLGTCEFEAMSEWQNQKESSDDVNLHCE